MKSRPMEVAGTIVQVTLSFEVVECLHDVRMTSVMVDFPEDKQLIMQLVLLE